MFENSTISATANEKLFYVIAIESALLHKDPIKISENVRAIENLITNEGADPNYISPVSGKTMLTHAVICNAIAVIMKLLSLGANPNLTGIDNLPLIIFTVHKNPSLVIPLIQNGVDLDVEYLVDGHKLTIKEVLMTIAAERGLDEIISEIDEIATPNQGLRFPIYDVVHVKKEYDREKSESRKHFLKMLLDSGYSRVISKPNARDSLLPLYDKFPNFSKAIDYIYRQLGLHELSDKSAFSMSPLLLSGPPGVGKTRFVRAVSEAIGVSSSMIGCGGISAGWVLGGSSTSWSEGKPGMVLTSLRDGLYANPIIMLDEIDKLGGDPRYDGYGALYCLLEKHTASNFIDEAVTVPMNCAMISWIATANYLEQLPKPILSRFSTIEIESPTKSQMRDVILSIYKDILEENIDTWGSRFYTEINEDVIDILSDSTPREASKKITDAFGVAAISRECKIYSLLPEDFSSSFKMKRRIGF